MHLKIQLISQANYHALEYQLINVMADMCYPKILLGSPITVTEIRSFGVEWTEIVHFKSHNIT